MSSAPGAPFPPALVRREDLGALVDALRAEHTVIGPTVRDGGIVLSEIDGVEALPAGWTDIQDAGRYRLERRADRALFGFVLGPMSWKRFLHLPSATLWHAERKNGTFDVRETSCEAPRFAFLGVRSCELAGISVLDKVLLGDGRFDPHYDARRRGVFVVAVQCTSPGGTCFCASMGTGPRARGGFDLALTEFLAPRPHEFLVEVGSPAGASLLDRVPHRKAAPEDLRHAEELTLGAERAMPRALDMAGVREMLYSKIDNRRWGEVADRCLACGNCTMVCPTCFCTTVLDRTDLAGRAEHTRVWDSCFTLPYSRMGPGSVRASIASRYRQWLTHKLASWSDQFGTPGCVGCGRCITWCPAGIDLTREIPALRVARDTRVLAKDTRTVEKPS
ncbi:MAG: 4Fe-4S dicluster domain-containing protein [Planctomycetes bacterium]|nr:4Fe-4S dicluster domain-containing protein [Planctomycetota bacterium]